MKTLRWLAWQLLMVLVNSLHLLMAALLLVISVVVPLVRLLRFAIKRVRGERLTARELLSIPHYGLRYFALSLSQAWSTHRVRIGEV